jgi:hypothetical protein
MPVRRDWTAVAASLDADGWARIPNLLTPRQCASARASFARDRLFRSTIDMKRHGYGSGQYRYFGYPLPALIARLRTSLYVPLAAVACRWAERLGNDPADFPPTLAGFLTRCHAAGQRRPTPLMLRYGPGDWNALHQDRYGAVAFPLQVLIVLSERGRDYDGGEVVLVEQRPRAQSRATTIAVDAGEGIVFTNRERPVRGTRGDHRVAMRHGVSVLTRGERYTLGIIFHDAE